MDPAKIWCTTSRRRAERAAHEPKRQRLVGFKRGHLYSTTPLAGIVYFGMSKSDQAPPMANLPVQYSIRPADLDRYGRTGFDPVH